MRWVLGEWYAARWGFSLNEGGTPINFHVNWRDGLFVYLYLFGRRFVRYPARQTGV